MSNLETLKAQLEEINKKKLKLQLLSEQAKRQCEEIEQKYNIHSLQEMQELVTKAEEEYQKSLKEAQEYITQTNNILDNYAEIL